MNIHQIQAPVLRTLRRRRMLRFLDLFGITQNTRVLDIGGTTFNWGLLDVRPRLVLVNLAAELIGQPDHGMSVVAADGCALPFNPGSFDVVFCNSLIEHLPPDRQQELASEIMRVSMCAFIQTPNFWFPVEPHFMAPFFHWIPRPARRRLAQRGTPWGLLTRPTREEAARFVDEIHLLNARRMARLFPDAEIYRERIGPLTKSLIAIRRRP